MNIRTPQPTQAARLLQQFFKTQGLEVKYSQALEAVARLNGYQDLQAMQADVRFADPLALTANSSNEFELRKKEHSAWIGVDGISVCVTRNDEGVSVDLYAKGREDDSLAGTYLHFAEVEDEEGDDEGPDADEGEVHSILSELCYNHDPEESLAGLARRVHNVVSAATGDGHKALPETESYRRGSAADAEEAHRILSELTFNHNPAVSLLDLARTVDIIARAATGVEGSVDVQDLQVKANPNVLDGPGVWGVRGNPADFPCGEIELTSAQPCVLALPLEDEASMTPVDWNRVATYAACFNVKHGVINGEKGGVITHIDADGLKKLAHYKDLSAHTRLAQTPAVVIFTNHGGQFEEVTLTLGQLQKAVEYAPGVLDLIDGRRLELLAFSAEGALLHFSPAANSLVKKPK
jgi:hypothetical protein